MLSYNLYVSACMETIHFQIRPGQSQSSDEYMTMLTHPIPGLRLGNGSVRFARTKLPSIKRKTEEWKKLSYDLRDLPFERLKQTVTNGTYRPSVGSRSLADLRDGGETPDDMARLADILGTMFAAGSDTGRPLSIRSPAAKRLPTFADREDLPYVEAIVKEVLRWNPDDVYNGWMIPKGSIVIGNTWAILRDENIYRTRD
ncbi:hypothetical protein MPER_05091 [Moniliophthora perniciosa FA553]|nr:hypothetical protein MPER_05091 [Moniliophthora perniciosa FA553]